MPAPTSMTPEQYVSAEATSPTKHEYVRGHLFAMAGSSDTHDDLVLNVCTLLRDQVSPREAYLLVDSHRQRIEVYERQASPFWRFATYEPGESAHLETLDVRLEDDVVYRGTEVPREAGVVG
jgi:Uma2 family endonuclease